jgi:hypothetical protein
MKRLLLLVSLVVLVSTFAAAQCAKIKDGTITDSAGNPVTVGFDQFGYNYQAHMFNGTYDSADRKLDGTYWGDNTGGYADDKLVMKWSDDWLSNQDCNGDHKLDRGGSLGYSTGWLTNEVEGDYLGSDGDYHHYTYHVKIVYDAGAACTQGMPSCIWNSYNIIEEINNDPFGEWGGMSHSHLARPGLGYQTK